MAEETKEPVGFSDLGLSETVLQALKAKGFEVPSPIQEKSIPILLEGKYDVIGQAQTGTGKTAAFGLPIIDVIEKEGKHVKAIILTPTRELAIQVSDELNSLKGKKRLNILPIYGGQPIDRQIMSLRKGIDIVVGTPGRVQDHIQRKTLKIDQLDFFVLDEADEMLNMGFLEDIEAILKVTNTDKRMLFFSATMPKPILKLAQSYMREGHQEIAVKAELTTRLTDQIYLELRREDKFEALSRIIDIEPIFFGIVFCRTKNDVDEVSQRLQERGYEAAGLHGDISQSQRERILSKFRNERTKILVATDVAARGIDVQSVTHVINYSLPQDPESYVHRIGRTGRAGKEGTAITFVSPSESRKLSFIERVTKTDIRKEDVPKVKDIIDAKKTRIVADVKEILKDAEEESFQDYMGIAKSILEEQSPEMALAALLKYTFSDDFKTDHYSEIRPARERGGRSERGERGGRENRYEREDRGGRKGRERGDREERGGRSDRGERGGRSERGGSSEYGERNGIRKEKCRLFVALGKKDSMTKRSLIDFIMEETNVPPRLIDDVQVMDAFSFITVPFPEAEAILNTFKKKQPRGEKSLVEKAKN